MRLSGSARPVVPRSPMFTSLMVLLLCVATIHAKWSTWTRALTTCNSDCTVCEERTCTGECGDSQKTRKASCMNSDYCSKRHLVNHAEIGSASQSSTNGHGLADRAIDGFWYSRYDTSLLKGPEQAVEQKTSCTHTESGGKPWLNVYLGQLKTINYVMVLNRMEAPNRMMAITLNVWKKHKIVGTCFLHENVSFIVPQRAPGLFKCLVPLLGDSVELTLLRGNDRILTVCELGIFTNDPGCWDETISWFGYDYSGGIHHNIWGDECAKWTSDFNVYRDLFSPDHNLCRNFHGSGMNEPFCFSKSGKKEKCPAPMCMQTSASQLHLTDCVGSPSKGFFSLLNGAMLYIVIVAGVLLLGSIAAFLIWRFCGAKTKEIFQRKQMEEEYDDYYHDYYDYYDYF